MRLDLINLGSKDGSIVILGVYSMVNYLLTLMPPRDSSV